MVSAYLQALANEGVATALVVSHLPLVPGYLVSELCPGNAPDVHHLGYRLRDAGCRRQGEFLWQKAPCNLKMASAI